MSKAISINNVNFSYIGDDFKILKNICLQVEEGEFLGIIGPNGGGKTTLLKLLLGLLHPQSGEIIIFGKQPKAARDMVGYVPQFAAFSRDFPISVEEVVLMGRLGKTKSLLGNYDSKDKKKVFEILKKLDIAHLAKCPLNKLSGGQLQRVTIARALVCEPKLILFDEPTANIDIHGEKNLLDLLQTINQEGITILLVSHDIGFISSYISRVACINRKLFCHTAASLTPEIMRQVYEMPIHVIDHH